MSSWGFLFASYIPDLEAKKLTNQKCPWVQTKETSSLQPKDQERDSPAREKICRKQQLHSARTPKKKKSCGQIHAVKDQGRHLDPTISRLLGAISNPATPTSLIPRPGKAEQGARTFTSCRKHQPSLTALMSQEPIFSYCMAAVCSSPTLFGRRARGRKMESQNFPHCLE